MIQISFDKRPKEKTHQKIDEFVHFDLRGKSIEDKVKLLILRDLWNVNWQIQYGRKKIIVSPPENYTKETVREAMTMKRLEILHKNKKWIKTHLKLAQSNLGNGEDVLNSEINPVIEVCKTQKQKDLFRILRYYWSSPYSEYVGRRIKLIVRDYGLPNKPVIGITALGSPIIHIPERDEWIGWDTATRTRNLIYTMDAYVVGAVPPYNYLLGGKLISYLLASNEVRKIHQDKYKNKITIIDKRTSNSLHGIFTTSLYGKSSQYNRLKFHDKLLYQPIGHTKGYGTLHLSKETIHEMVKLLKSKNRDVNHRFGDGPSWVMRVISAAGELLGFDSDFLLRHSFKRSIYFVPLAKNFREVLNGQVKRPKYFNYSKKDLVNFWKKRWLEKRKQNPEVVMNVLEFEPNHFVI